MLRGKVSIHCPFCHQRTSVEAAPIHVPGALQSFTVPALWEKDVNSSWWIGVCNYCQQPVLVKNDGEVVYPTPMPEPTHESVPDLIRSDLDEAKKCFAVEAWRACAVMARRAMQSAALDKGAKPDKLASQMAELEDKGIITRKLREWADAVRWVGNDAAHPSGEPLSRNDAEAILKLTEQFLYVLYVVPSIANDLLAKKGK